MGVLLRDINFVPDMFRIIIFIKVFRRFQAEDGFRDRLVLLIGRFNASEGLGFRWGYVFLMIHFSFVVLLLK